MRRRPGSPDQGHLADTINSRSLTPHVPGKSVSLRGAFVVVVISALENFAWRFRTQWERTLLLTAFSSTIGAWSETRVSFATIYVLLGTLVTNETI